MMMKTTSLFALAGLALTSSLMADEQLPQAQAVEIQPVPEIAICRMPAPVSLINQLPDMEANEEAIQSILQNEKAKTTIEKLNAPLFIQSMEEANKHLTRASMEKITVDFEKQQLVIFAWQGSGQDRLGGHMPASQDAVANLHYTKGQTKDLKTHSVIFAMPKDAKVKVNEQPRIIRCGVGDVQRLQIEPMQLQLDGNQKFELKIEPQQLNGNPQQLELRIQPQQKAE